MFEDAGFLVYVQEVTWCKQVRTTHLKVSHHTHSPVLEVDCLLLPLPFRDVPVDSLFVVNSRQNTQIGKSFSDELLQC